MKINSKFITMSLITSMLLSSVPAMAQDNDIIEVYVNNEQVVFDVNPIIENERTLVPLRAIFEALGAEVAWDQETRTASATRGTDTVSITIDSNVLYKNDSAVELDVPAKIVDDRTLVPVRAISESFDAEVTWVQETQSVYIVTSEGVSPVTVEQLTLSEADLKVLIDIKEDIRYAFEQAYLPQYVLSSETLYDDMSSLQTISDILYNEWDKTAISYILDIQMNSETEYVLDSYTDASYIIAAYQQILKDAGLDYETMFNGVTNLETKDGIRVAVLEFKSTTPIDPLKIQCKYIGIIQSKDGEPRYFTAESDPFQTGTWYFCEVTTDSRGTILTFDKVDEETDLDTFINIMGAVYTENVQTQVELQTN